MQIQVKVIFINPIGGPICPLARRFAIVKITVCELKNFRNLLIQKPTSQEIRSNHDRCVYTVEITIFNLKYFIFLFLYLIRTANFHYTLGCIKLTTHNNYIISLIRGEHRPMVIFSNVHIFHTPTSYFYFLYFVEDIQ